MSTDFTALAMQAGSVFTPGSPVNEKDLFAGRQEQFDSVLRAVGMRGYHAILFGERGVGKTSLANVVAATLSLGPGWLSPRVNCDGTDTFDSLWRKAFKDILLTSAKQNVGFSGGQEVSYQRLSDSYPASITPDDVRRVMQDLSQAQKIVVSFDEFDRISDKSVTVLMSDTIKMLSDYGIDATVVLIGVADSVAELVIGHQSIERALVQIPMPRMSTDEVSIIIENGLKRLGMTIKSQAKGELTQLSQGLPYITHLLALHSVFAALSRGSLEIGTEDVGGGITASLNSWQQSITNSYYEATRSSQPGNIYKQVLLACALAQTDELGYFTAAAVRTPLQTITKRDYDIPNFAQHLKNFSDEGRGGILSRTGETRRIRYRFTGPLIRPYIVMRGFSEGMISREQMKTLASAVG